MNKDILKDYVIGHTVELKKIFTEDSVKDFALLTGDTNLIHLDKSYAAKTQFKKPIVHGMNVASLFGTIFGTIYPGIGSIYMGQELKFVAPVYINDEITAKVTLEKLHETKPIGFFKTICYKEDSKVVIEGKAVVLIPT